MLAAVRQVRPQHIAVGGGPVQVAVLLAVARHEGDGQVALHVGGHLEALAVAGIARGALGQGDPAVDLGVVADIEAVLLLLHLKAGVRDGALACLGPVAAGADQAGRQNLADIAILDQLCQMDNFRRGAGLRADSGDDADQDCT